MPSAAEDEEDNKEKEEEGNSDDEAGVAENKAMPSEVAAGELVSGLGYLALKNASPPPRRAQPLLSLPRSNRPH